MTARFRSHVSALLLSTALLCTLNGAAAAQSVAPVGTAASSASTVASTEVATPKPDDTQAERMKSQPGNNAPFWRSVRESGTQPGYSSLPGAEKGQLVQAFVDYPGVARTNAGEAWRQVRNRWILPYGGSMILLVLTAIGIFYWRKGAMGGHEPDTGRRVERFTPFERAAHWWNAGAFLALAASGVVMAFGKFFLLPVMGGTLFGWLTYALKTMHNFVGPLFAVTLCAIFFTFVKDNIANKADVAWLKRGGGLFGDEQIPSHRFNAGEKGLFWWGITIPGLVIVASGFVLDKLLPGLDYLRGDMQMAHMIHAAMAILMICFLCGHIYMGTIGMKGALDAMKTGYVDEGWAKEHHSLWMDDIRAGKIPAQRSTANAAASSTDAQASTA